MTKEELIAAAESIGMRFTGATIPPVSEDREDAERYRWLCETATEAQWGEFGGYTNKRHIDDVIDAAMQEDKP